MKLIILEECGRTPDEATRDSIIKKFMETEDCSNLVCLAGQMVSKTQTLLMHLAERSDDDISILLIETSKNRVTVLGEAEKTDFLTKLGQVGHELSSDLALEILR